MDISAGIKASLAGRYASALFDLASENGSVTAVESDLETLGVALGESADLAALTTNFIGVLAANRRLAKLPAIISAFKAIAAAQRGEVSATVTSAHPLTETQLKALKTKLTAREGRTVMLSAKVDPDLLGGLVVTIGSQRIDASIRTRLNSLAMAMQA